MNPEPNDRTARLRSLGWLFWPMPDGQRAYIHVSAIIGVWPDRNEPRHTEIELTNGHSIVVDRRLSVVLEAVANAL